jgi:uncharacterized membrane protein YedE/YeeE
MEYIYKDNNWRLVGIVFGLGWQLSEAQIAFILPVSIEDRPLLWMVVRSIILSTYSLRPKKSVVLEFQTSCLTIRLIQKNFYKYHLFCYDLFYH